MARTIAIELEVNGVKESVKTIGELETAIEQLTNELKNTDIGSEKFNRLTNELNKAKSELKTFEASFEGLDPQQKTQAYVAFAESVSSGILLAQEALRSFGVENESVNSAVEASTKAINFALQGRIVLEGALEARVLATTLAQRALNTSVVAGNKYLKVLFTTMAANPLGAVLAVVGLLVAAFIALSDSEEEATTSLSAYNDMVKQSTKQTAVSLKQLEFYGSVVNDVSRSENERKVALEQLNKLGVITEGITLDQVGALDKLNERLELARENTILQAQAQAAASLLSQAFEAQIEAQNTTLEDNLTFFDKLLNSFTSFGNSYLFAIQNAQDALENQQEAIDEATTDITIYENLLIQITNKLLENEGKLKKTREEAAKDQKEQNSLLEDFVDNLDDAGEAINKLNRELLDFGSAPEPKIIEDLRELVSLQLQLRDATREQERTFTDVFTEYTKDVEKAKSTTDIFGIQIELLRKQLTRAFEAGDVELFQSNLDAARKLFFDTGDTFNEEQKRAALEILQGYEVAFNRIVKLGIDSSSEFENTINPLIDGLTEKLRFEGEIGFENLGGDIQTLLLTLKDAENGTNRFYETRQKLIDEITKQLQNQQVLEKLTAEEREKANENITKFAEEQADAIIQIITDTAKAEDAIRGVLKVSQDLTAELNTTNGDFEELFGFIIKNFDKLSEEFDITKLFEGDNVKLQSNIDAITNLLLQASNQVIDLETYTQEEREKILEFFLERRKELLEKNSKTEQKTQLELLEETLNNYQEIVNGLNQLTLSLGEASQLQIERIETRREESLNNIVGDTKEAEDLRTEITEQANKEIVEIERKARLRELQFTKIQSIADLAQALVNAQKLPPPFNAIQSGIVATAGGIQIAVIQSQIDDLQGAQGFATGGFVSGPGTSTSDSIPALLSDGEFVVNAKSTKRFLPLLEKINNQEEQFRKFNNGGFVLDGSSFMGSTIQNNFDDSRIIEELRKTRQEPLRAYVFEKDITEAQQIEKRLQELSKL